MGEFLQCHLISINVHFVFAQKDINAYQVALQKFPHNVYRANVGKPVSSEVICDSSMRYGYFILHTETREEMHKLLHILEIELRDQ